MNDDGESCTAFHGTDLQQLYINVLKYGHGVRVSRRFKNKFNIKSVPPPWRECAGIMLESANEFRYRLEPK